MNIPKPCCIRDPSLTCPACAAPLCIQCKFMTYVSTEYTIGRITHCLFCATKFHPLISRDLFNLNLWWQSADFPAQARTLVANNITARVNNATTQAFATQYVNNTSQNSTNDERAAPDSSDVANSSPNTNQKREGNEEEQKFTILQ